nr:hypothetical protein [Rhodoferax sp.]
MPPMPQTDTTITEWSLDQLAAMLRDELTESEKLTLKDGCIEVQRVVFNGKSCIEKRYLRSLSERQQCEMQQLLCVGGLPALLNDVASLASSENMSVEGVRKSVARTRWYGHDTSSWMRLAEGDNSPFRRSVPTMLAWVSGVLRACYEFHRLGFVHCDLLPQNIVIRHRVDHARPGRYTLLLDQPFIIDLELCLGPNKRGLWGKGDQRDGWFRNNGAPLFVVPARHSEFICAGEIVKRIDKDDEFVLDRVYRMNGESVVVRSDPFADLPRVDWGVDLFSLGIALQVMLNQADFQGGYSRSSDDAYQYLEKLPKLLRSFNQLAPKGGVPRPNLPHREICDEINRLITTSNWNECLIKLPARLGNGATAVNPTLETFDNSPWNGPVKRPPRPTWKPAATGAVLALTAAAGLYWKLAPPQAADTVSAPNTASVSPAAGTIAAPTQQPPAQPLNQPAVPAIGPSAQPISPPANAAPSTVPAPVPTQAPSPADQLLATLRSVSLADFGTAPWRNAVDELAGLCRTASKSTDTQACTGAWNGIQQAYLERSTQAKQDAWIVESHYLKPDKPEPSKPMLAWLDATAVLAGHGVWLAQVNEAIGGMVAWRQKIQPAAIETSSRADAAQKLVNLVRTGGRVASAFGEEPSAASVRQYRIDGAAWLWVVARAGQWGHTESGKVAPVSLVLPTVQALADMPSQNLQNKLAYSLMCWSAKLDKARALRYLAKARVPEDTGADAKKIAHSAKVQTNMIRNGEDLCAPPLAKK